MAGPVRSRSRSGAALRGPRIGPWSGPVAVLALAAALAVTSAACGDDGEDRFDAAYRKSLLTTTVPGTPRATGEPSRSPATPTTSTPIPSTLAESLLAAVEAYRAALGPSPVRALRLVVHVPAGSAPYASLQSQDLPFSPATVVRVYVDGGDRSTGGYVELLADGSVAEVQA